MKKKFSLIFSLLVILVFIAYIIVDSIKKPDDGNSGTAATEVTGPADAWKIEREFKIEKGQLKAVAVSNEGLIYLGGKSFVACYDKDLNPIWSMNTDSTVYAVSAYGDSIYAATSNQILIISKDGKLSGEWGPFEDNSIFTSVSSNKNFIAIGDAGNKMVFILDKGGEVKKMIGQNDGQFVIPSPYFDVALDYMNDLFTANTGRHRIETRTIDGALISFFGEAGTAPEYFCGCCAPPHFAVIPDGFVTAEKGINRIKILNKKGEFVEFVNSKNNFIKSVPLDLASSDGITIYAANPADSKLYIFTRK